jgi:hypothetical protein
MGDSSHDRAARFQTLSETLKRLGYANENRVNLYGQEFRLVSDPIVMSDSLVFIDAIETRNGFRMRLRVPLNIVIMAQARLET